MKQTVRFKGLSLNRDEQSVEPGELSLCGDMQLYDGALRPAVITGDNVAGGNAMDGDLIYIHQTANHEVFLFHYKHESTNVLRYSYEDKEGNNDVWHNFATSPSVQRYAVITSPTGFDPDDIRDIKSVGNTLIIMTSAGVFYFLWNANDNAYKTLGQQPPFLELQFNLHYDEDDQAKNEEQYEMLFDSHLFDNEHDAITWPNSVEIRSEISGTVTEQVMARVNERIQEGTSKGLFYAPFFVRYCYRLYDGTSLIMHSPPVLMMPNLPRSVLTAIWDAVFYDDGHWQLRNFNEKLTFSVFLIFTSLQMKLWNSSALSTLKSDWGDIVKSVDIFVSPQFSRIDTSKKIEHVIENYSDPNMAIYDGLLEGITYAASQGNSYNFGEAFGYTYRSRGGADVKNTISFEMPEYPIGEFHGRIRNNSSFYLLASYNIKDIGDHDFDNLTTLKYDESKVNYVTVQEQMTDDYKTHNILVPASQDTGGMYVYNHRLNVYGISERLFKGFMPNVAFPYVSPDESEKKTVTALSIFVNTDSGRRELKTTGLSQISLPWLINNGYYFYPDGRADLLKLTVDGTPEQTVWRRMDESLTLNGSVSFVPGATPTNINVQSTEDDIVPMPNKIYTSRADNPFYFPNLPGESGINSVGTGSIIGVAAVTRALSQGQVGDHDLVVFASDGIWVLKVSAQGTYSQIHNISREVCVNKNSICQLDQSVVFATNRSLSRIVESDVISISELLDGPQPCFYDPNNLTPVLLPGLAGLINNSDINRLLAFGTRAIDIFVNGTVFYDYTSNRLIVLPANTDNTTVSFVFSIRDKAWATMNIPAVRGVVNGYPSMCLQWGGTGNSAGKVIRLKTPYDYTDSNTYKGVVITRTLTFSDTMDVLRGFRQMSDLATMPQLFFYGSNNQRTWQLIGQTNQEYYNYLPGHPFRFFRIAIYFSSIKTSEEYQELILEVINKYAKL